MKYIRKTSYDIKENFLENLLIDRKVLPEKENEKDAFYNPTWNNLLDYRLLDNIEAAADMIEKHIKAGNKIYLLVDCDVDGYTSGTLFYDYIIKNYKNDYPDFSLDYHIPEGKEHGLQTLIKELGQEKKYDLMVIPEAGINDVEEHK